MLISNLISEGGGVLSYTLCTDGCRYLTDKKINVTFPPNMYDKELLPLGEKVSSSWGYVGGGRTHHPGVTRESEVTLEL